MFLTKKPQCYKEYEFPGNCYLGTTIETTGQLQRSHIMMSIMNKKFASIEPIMSDFAGMYLKHFDLIIIGADSSLGAIPPPLHWIESVEHPNIWYKNNLTRLYPQLKKK